jgi:hypothetical protein
MVTLLVTQLRVNFSMKKLLGIVVLGLLLSGNVYSTILSVDEQKNLINNGTIKKGMTKEDLELTISPSVWSTSTVNLFDLKKSGIKVWCSLSGTYPLYQDIGYCFSGKKNNKKSVITQIWENPFDMVEHWSGKATHKKNIKKINILRNDLLVSKKRDNSIQTNTANSSSNSLSMSTDDKITQAKQICRDLGFKTNTEKFADCALQMMSIQFETTNKVASSSGGTTQEIIVKHKNDYDVWDALLDVSNVLLSDGNNSSSSSSNSNTRCVIGKTNPMFGTTTMNCN